MDLPEILCARDEEAFPDRIEIGKGAHAETEVLDGTPSSELAPITDD